MNYQLPLARRPIFRLKVVGVLPIAVDAVNDPPKVVMPHHHVMKFGAFEVWNRYLQTQTGLSATTANLTLGILTDTPSGQIMLRGIDSEDVNLQVISASADVRFCLPRSR